MMSSEKIEKGAILFPIFGPVRSSIFAAVLLVVVYFYVNKSAKHRVSLPMRA